MFLFKNSDLAGSSRSLCANALGDIPTVVMVGGGLLAGLYWITNRRKLVALAEAEEAAARSGKGKDQYHV